MRKNVDGQSVGFQMISATDGSDVTSGTPTVYYTIDRGTQGTGAGTSTHEGNGQWSYAPTQAETNGDHVLFTMAISGAVSQGVNVYPVAFNPGDSVRLGITALPNAAAGAAGGLPTDSAGKTSFNDLTAAVVNAEVDQALIDIKLDHLIAVAETDDPVNNSIIAKLAASDGDWSGFDNTADSLEAIRDRGDSAWLTGGGGALTQIIDPTPLIPFSIDLANTATVRLGLMLVNSVDDLPSTAEITPGTISIDRKAIGGTSWSAVVTDAACSESAGLVYYDEVFDSGTGYAEGDSIRVTFKSQSVTADANTHEVTGAAGVIFQTAIRQTMRGTDSGALASALATVDGNVDAILVDTAAIEVDTQDIQSRLPAALLSGRMSSDTVAISGSTDAADNLERSAETIVAGTAQTGTLSTTQMTTDLSEATDDHYIGRVIIWTSGALKDQASDITDYTGVGGLLEYTAVTEAPSNGDTFVIV